MEILNKHLFPYEWNLKDINFKRDKGTVFSCFSCGGGSTMGYELAGFDVIGCNEIDPKTMEAYEANLNPKYSYTEAIQDFKLRKDLPQELYNLDILDGSPPCSNFSMSGRREKDWGKKKKFREGQVEQVLDTLFFDFIDLAKELQPKIVIAENVKGLLMGRAKEYVVRINEELDKAGYVVITKLLNASHMGVPQRRERVFFIALRKDLVVKVEPLDLEFNEEPIKFGEVEDGVVEEFERVVPCDMLYYDQVLPGKSIASVHPKGNRFNSIKLSPDLICNTIASGSALYHYEQPRRLTKKELCKISSYPLDYDFKRNKPLYLIGMSVPPVMIAQIATRIYDQWLSKLSPQSSQINN